MNIINLFWSESSVKVLVNISPCVVLQFDLSTVIFIIICWNFKKNSFCTEDWKAVVKTKLVVPIFECFGPINKKRLKKCYEDLFKFKILWTLKSRNLVWFVPWLSYEYYLKIACINFKDYFQRLKTTSYLLPRKI